jgi:hypothetical protein
MADAPAIRPDSAAAVNKTFLDRIYVLRKESKTAGRIPGSTILKPTVPASYSPIEKVLLAGQRRAQRRKAPPDMLPAEPRRESITHVCDRGKCEFEPKSGYFMAAA